MKQITALLSAALVIGTTGAHLAFIGTEDVKPQPPRLSSGFDFDQTKTHEPQQDAPTRTAWVTHERDTLDGITALFQMHTLYTLTEVPVWPPDPSVQPTYEWKPSGALGARVLVHDATQVLAVRDASHRIGEGSTQIMQTETGYRVSSQANAVGLTPPVQVRRLADQRQPEEGPWASGNWFHGYYDAAGREVYQVANKGVTIDLP